MFAPQTGYGVSPRSPPDGNDHSDHFLRCLARLSTSQCIQPSPQQRRIRDFCGAEGVSKLVFYAQSTGAVISGRSGWRMVLAVPTVCATVSKESMHSLTAGGLPYQSMHSLTARRLPSQSMHSLTARRLPSQSMHSLTARRLPSQSMHSLIAGRLPSQSMHSLTAGGLPYQSMHSLTAGGLPYQSMHSLTAGGLPSQPCIH